MKEYILWRKMARIIMQLAETLEIAPEKALCYFYASHVVQQLHDPQYGYQLMSDTYIVNDVLAEIREGIVTEGCALEKGN